MKYSKKIYSYFKNLVWSRWKGRNTFFPYTPFGAGDFYPQEILSTLENSSHLSKSVNLMCRFVKGDGFEGNESDLTHFENYVINEKGDTIYDIFEAIISDEITFGGHAIQVAYKINPFTQKIEPYAFQHIPLENVRKGIEDREGNFNDYYIVPFASFVERKTLYDNMYKIDKFTTDQEELKAMIQKAGGIENWYGTLYYSYQQTSTSRFYPKPFWASIVPQAISDAELQNTKLKAIQSGFSAKVILTKYGENIEQSDMQSDVQSISDFQGSEGALIMLQYAKNKESKPDVDTISPANLDKILLETEKSIKSDILEMFYINQNLYGSLVAGKLGSSSEIQELIDYTNKIIVRQFQRRIENTFSTIFSQLSFEDQQKIKCPERFVIKSFSVISNNNQNDIEILAQQTQLQAPESIENIDMIEEPSVSEVTYNGAQIQSALTIIQNVKDGIISSEQGIIFFQEFLKIEPNLAQKIFRGT